MKKSIVLSVGMPRAGSGWFHNITKILVEASGGVEANLIRKKYHLNRLLTEMNCNIGTITSYRLIPVLAPILFEPNYVIKLHGGRKPLADLLITAGVIKPTFIYRDPRDAALSIYEYGQLAQKRPLASNDFARINSIEEAIDYITPYIEIARGWINSRHTFVIRYEDMFIDFDEKISQLLDFLDLRIDLAHALSLIKGLRPGVKSAPVRLTHYMKGKTGRYKEKFTPEQIQLCMERFGDFLKEQGFIASSD